MKTLALLLFCISLWTPSISQTCQDADGNVYKTITIGSQTWMAENMKCKTDSNYWAYGNDQNNISQYGYLYSWKMANNVCPIGWHLPSEADWKVLSDYLGDDAGGKIKLNGTELWNSPNTGATNESGFSAKPGGYRFSSGASVAINREARFWSSTVPYASGGRYAGISYQTTRLLIASQDKKDGLSVRCIKD